MYQSVPTERQASFLGIHEYETNFRISNTTDSDAYVLVSQEPLPWNNSGAAFLLAACVSHFCIIISAVHSEATLASGCMDTEFQQYAGSLQISVQYKTLLVAQS